MASALHGERAARRAIEDQDYTVHNANILFQQHCPNIDLVVYGPHCALYVQVKTSTTPAGKDAVVVDGSPFTDAQLYADAPIFNKHDAFFAALVLIVDVDRAGVTRFYLAPPAALEEALRQTGRAWAEHPKRDGTKRSVGFRKELPRPMLATWENAWHLLERAADV